MRRRNKPRRRLRGPTDRNKCRIARALAVLAKGYSMAQAAEILGTTVRTLYQLKHRHPELWDQEPDWTWAQDVPPPPPKPPKPPRVVAPAPVLPREEVQRLRINPLTEENMKRVATLLASGKTMAESAEVLGKRPETLKSWARDYRELWAAVCDTAMATAAALIMENPRRAASDPKERARQQRRLERWMDVRGQKLLPQDGRLTVMGFLEETYRPRKLLGRSPASLEEMRSAVRFLNRYLERVARIEDFNDETIAAFMAWRLDTGARAPTVNKQRASLLALWRFAKRCKLLDAEPDVDRIPEEKAVPTCWSMEEFGRILRAAAAVPGLVAEIPAGDWWTALLLTAYDTGARIRALLLSEGADLDLAGGWIRLKAVNQKQKAEQVFKLSGDTLAALAKIIKPGPGPIFPWPWDPKRRVLRALGRRYQELLRSAGFAPTRRSQFHKIRRTTATHLAAIAGELAASAYLGHSCVQVTRAYLDPTKIEKIHAAELMPRPVVPGDRRRSLAGTPPRPLPLLEYEEATS